MTPQLVPQPQAVPGEGHLTGEQFGELLSRFTEEARSEATPAEAHVQTCEACAMELASLREAITLFRDASIAYAEEELRGIPRFELPRRRLFQHSFVQAGLAGCRGNVSGRATTLAGLTAAHSNDTGGRIERDGGRCGHFDSVRRGIAGRRQPRGLQVGASFHAGAGRSKRRRNSSQQRKLHYKFEAREGLRMTLQLTFKPLTALAAFVMCGLIAIVPSAPAQQTPADPTANAQSPAAAPIERQPPQGPGMQPGMRQAWDAGWGNGCSQAGCKAKRCIPRCVRA